MILQIIKHNSKYKASVSCPDRKWSRRETSDVPCEWLFYGHYVVSWCRVVPAWSLQEQVHCSLQGLKPPGSRCLEPQVSSGPEPPGPVPENIYNPPQWSWVDTGRAILSALRLVGQQKDRDLCACQSVRFPTMNRPQQAAFTNNTYSEFLPFSV